MFKPFNNNEVMELKVSYQDKELQCVLYEQPCDGAIKAEMNFNLVVIEFAVSDGSPFNTPERRTEYDGEIHCGYIVDITNSKLKDISLLFLDREWGEYWHSAVLTEGTQEFEFVCSILKQANAVTEVVKKPSIDTLECMTVQDLGYAKALGVGEGEVEKLSLFQMKNKMQMKSWDMESNNTKISKEEAEALNSKYNEIVETLEFKHNVDLSADYIIDFKQFAQ